MANSLLDFVVSLVRDADAAEAYAANPEQAIADANLTGVTSADVDGLIPVVSESMANPLGDGAELMDGNVWASGSATAAFDAFSADIPVTGVAEEASELIDQPLVAADVDDMTEQVSAFTEDSLPTAGLSAEDAEELADRVITDSESWEQSVSDAANLDFDSPGFDAFA